MDRFIHLIFLMGITVGRGTCCLGSDACLHLSSNFEHWAFFRDFDLFVDESDLMSLLFLKLSSKSDEDEVSNDSVDVLLVVSVDTADSVSEDVEVGLELFNDACP